MNQAKRIARQQLQSLRLSGIVSLPRPTQRYQFYADEDSITELHSAIGSGTNMNSIDTKQSSTSSQLIRESRSRDLPEKNHAEPFAWRSGDQPSGDRGKRLDIIRAEVADCTRCSELSSCRTKTVFGVGSPQAELCFLGEGPGADEDRQGEPFVGQAGQLLNRIIEACKMKREEVYILNTVKCRPPGNRNPADTELHNCWPYAIEQLEIIQPKFICCLGSVAAKTLLETKQSIGRLRGQFFKYRGSQVVVTYHPAYLLRNPSAKRQVWDDMKMLMSAMGREI
ncbi:MAG: uracil-DNA glycosylase [Planctomycetota bacterium]